MFSEIVAPPHYLLKLEKKKGPEGITRELGQERRIHKRNRRKSYQTHWYLKCIVTHTVRFLGIYFIILSCFY